jgi:hypothetical protein
MHEVSGNVGENRDRLISLIERQGIELVFTEKIAPAMGASYGGRIAILPGQSEAEEFSTLVHELAHELLKHAERRTATTKEVRETEAEAIAFVVGKAVGWSESGHRFRRLYPPRGSDARRGDFQGARYISLVHPLLREAGVIPKAVRG